MFDSMEISLDGRMFKGCNWKEYSPDTMEAMPNNIPEPFVERPIQQIVFIDADHACCHLTRHPHGDDLIFVNRASIIWSSNGKEHLSPLQLVASLLPCNRSLI
jgi:hypothetical protein